MIKAIFFDLFYTLINPRYSNHTYKSQEKQNEMKRTKPEVEELFRYLPLDIW